MVGYCEQCKAKNQSFFYCSEFFTSLGATAEYVSV